MMSLRPRPALAPAAWLFAGGLLAACTPAALPAPPTISPNCEAATDPTDDDIDFASRFSGNTFTTGSWERSLSSDPFRVTVSWQNHDEGALAHLEVLIYSCGHSQADLDDYFSGENFETVIFQDYQDLARQAICRLEDADLTLREFTARTDATDYVIRHWVVPYGPARVIDLLLVFPADSADRIDPYAEALFPELPSCG